MAKTGLLPWMRFEHMTCLEVAYSTVLSEFLQLIYNSNAIKEKLKFEKL